MIFCAFDLAAIVVCGLVERPEKNRRLDSQLASMLTMGALAAYRKLMLGNCYVIERFVVHDQRRTIARFL